MTKRMLIDYLHESVVGITFALREPKESVLVVPATFWARVKQVFTGPVFRSRIGEVEIAVIPHDHLITDKEREAFTSALDAIRPVGIAVSFVEYEP
jgi:hypothetical protein